ncbi:MAG: hypothetical protein WB760_14265 [Xanthobacteraceae bacterium]
MTKVDCSGAILRGALAKAQARKTIDDNPYANMPGTFVLHKTWRYGYEHSEEVIAEWENKSPSPEYRAQVNAYLAQRQAAGR